MWYELPGEGHWRAPQAAAYSEADCLDGQRLAAHIADVQPEAAETAGHGMKAPLTVVLAGGDDFGDVDLQPRPLLTVLADVPEQIDAGQAEAGDGDKSRRVHAGSIEQV